MNQQEMDARLGEIGGGDLVHMPVVATKKVKVTKPGELGPEESEQEVSIHRWMNEQTGYVLEAYQNPDGSWVVTKDNPRGYKPTKPAASTTTRTQQAGTPRVEGTPLPGGGYDNEKPLMVTRDSQGNIVGQARQLTPAERKDWEESRQRSRNPGGKTDAEARAEQTQTTRTPVTGKPGITQVTTKNPTTGETETHFEDASGNRVATPTESPKETRTTVQGKDGKTYIQVTRTDSATGKSELWHEDQDGHRVQLPVDSKTAPLPKGTPRYTPDPSDPTGDYGLSAFDAALRDAHEKGLITTTQAADLMEEAGRTATVAEATDNRRQTQSNTLYGHDVTQRGQDLNEVQSRRTASQHGVDEALRDYSAFSGKLVAGEGGLAAKVFRDVVNEYRRSAEQYGGMNDVAPVEIPPALQAIRRVKINADGSMSIQLPDPTPNTPLTAADKAAQAQAAGAGSGESTGTPPAVQGRPSEVGDTGAPPVAAQGQERPDDILTVRDQWGNTGQMTRERWDANPLTREGNEVINAEANPARSSTSSTQPPAGRPDQTQAATQIEDAINPPAAPSIPQASPIPSDAPTSRAPIPDALQFARSTPILWQPHPATIAKLKQDGYSQEEIDEVLRGMAA